MNFFIFLEILMKKLKMMEEEDEDDEFVIFLNFFSRKR